MVTELELDAVVLSEKITSGWKICSETWITEKKPFSQTSSVNSKLARDSKFHTKTKKNKKENIEIMLYTKKHTVNKNVAHAMGKRGKGSSPTKWEQR